MRTKCVRAAWSFALCLSVALTACDDENNENDGPVVPPPVDESIDLTASEAYANCFIVTEADEYRFATRKVDGSDVEGIVSVDWLWSTKNAAGNPLVSEVSYKDGIVHFTSDGTEGNTVLAAFDAKGEVIWSWHLWMTDQPELFAYDEGGELMDRNLGATSALEADGAASFGLLYQWGRKDPFYGGEKNEDSGDGVFLRARESTIVNPAHASLAWIAVQCDEQVGTVAYATAHPTTFLFNSPNGNKDWLFTGEDALWDNAGKKTNYDPCPAGYRVPDQAAWGNISSYNVDDGRRLRNDGMLAAYGGRFECRDVLYDVRHLCNGKIRFQQSVGLVGSLPENELIRRSRNRPDHIHPFYTPAAIVRREFFRDEASIRRPKSGIQGCAPVLRGHSPISMSRTSAPSTTKRSAVRTLWMP